MNSSSDSLTKKLKSHNSSRKINSVFSNAIFNRQRQAPPLEMNAIEYEHDSLLRSRNESCIIPNGVVTFENGHCPIQPSSSVPTNLV